MNKFHKYPFTYIIYITTAFIIGISLSFYFKNIFMAIISTIIAFILLTIFILFFIIKNKNYIFLFYLSFIFISFSYTTMKYYDIFLNPLNKFNRDIEAYSAKIIFYDGVVNFKDRYIAYVDLVYDGYDWYNYSGYIRLYYTHTKPIYIGDKIVVQSKINLYKNILTNFSDSDKIINVLENKMLYGVSNIYPYINFNIEYTSFSIINYINKIFLPIRNKIKKYLFNQSNTITYSIIQALITGDDNIIPKDIHQNFVDSGIAHILSISGLHISMIILIVSFILSFFNINFYTKITIATITTIIFYTSITLFSISVIRASIMALCILISYYYDRNKNTLNALFLACLIILIISPNAIREVSFQFSFLATLSIVLYYPIFEYLVLNKIKNINNFYIKKILYTILSFIFINIITLIFITPFNIYHFSIINLTSLITNIFAIPLTFIIIFSSFITIFFAFFYRPISYYTLKTSEYFTNLLINISKYFSNIDYFRYKIEINLYTTLLIIVLIVILGFIFRIIIENKKRCI